ncbi:polygalacturonase-like [Momordica charantia]|uniref:Polygalacturonase-like n=1 Tax=Momordica charantia TaxID=3673 RepID=A0A6J1DJH0_MOMCH|nr:polygalacturonase-like [Momordica charantia]
MGLKSNFVTLPLLLLLLSTAKGQSAGGAAAAGAATGAAVGATAGAVGAAAGAAVGAAAGAVGGAAGNATGGAAGNTTAGAAGNATTGAAGNATGGAGGVFDVTTYGAKPDTDITAALINAWKEACASTTPSKVLIPKGSYQFTGATINGPCKSSIELQVEGTLKAPPEPKGEGWLFVEYVDFLTISGTGVFDGNGKAGDDCISVGDTNKQIVISDVTCGPGHGISIGSLGKYTKEKEVVGVTVKKCKLINTSNGVRIKTWPDAAVSFPATDMHFEDIEMTNVSFPIIIDQEYCPWNQCNRKVPSSIKISKVSFKNIRGTSATPIAVKIVCSKSVPCEGVEIADIDLTYNGSQGPIKSQCANVKPVITGKQNPPICAEVAPADAPSID